MSEKNITVNVETNTKKGYIKKIAVALMILCVQTLVTFVSFEMISRAGKYKKFKKFLKHSTKYAIITVITIFALYMMLYLLTNDLRANMFLHILLLVLGVADCIKFAERKEFVEWADILILGEAQEAADDLTITIWPLIIAGALAMLLLYALIHLTKRFWKMPKRSKKAVAGGLVVVVITCVGMCVCYSYVAEKHLMATLTKDLTYYEKGGIASFAESIVYSSMVDSSTSYAIYDEVLALYGYDENGEPLVEGEEDTTVTIATDETVAEIEVKPNIIVIMSESLWDINQLSDIVEYSENPLAEFEALAAEYPSGYTAVNVYGGGTDKSEYEFVTGWSSKYLISAKSAYKRYFNVGQASLVQYLEQIGYVSYAIHPFRGSFWNRTNAYENMGYDNFYDMYSMYYQDTEYVFISDESVTNEIIYRYEQLREETDDPVFSFTTTVQNHVSTLKIDPGDLEYSKDITLTYKIDVSGIDQEYLDKFERYVTGVKKSGEALAELIEYFSNVEEPTVIVVFGDHAPGFLTEFEEFLDEDLVNEGFYETPFYVWNNYGLGDFGTEYTSLSDLSTYLLEYIDFPLTKQALFKKYLHSYCVVDTLYEVKASDGTYVDTEDSEYKTRAYSLFYAMQASMNYGSYDTELWTVLSSIAEE